MRPKSSTPNAANMKNRSRKRRLKLPTWGRAFITVFNNERIPFAVFKSFSTAIT